MATQRDIAEKLGVSVSLVSRVLSGKAEAIGVSPDTIERVRTAADRMGYVPNAQARILKGAPGMTFGVLVYDFEDPFFGAVIGALQAQAGEKGYSLVLAGFHRRQVAERDLEPLLKHRIDGLVIVGSAEIGDWVEPFRQDKIPMVRIGTGPLPADVAEVGVDEMAGMRLLVEHLVGLGHRKIGYVGGAETYQPQRFLAFRQALEDSRQTLEDPVYAPGDGHVSEAGYAATRALLDRGQDLPTALVAASDLVALGVLRALNEAGYRVPDDVSVAGFDDLPFAAMASPSLTTIHQPFNAFAKEAVAFLSGSRRAERPLMLEPRLVTRASCGRAGRALSREAI